QFGRIARIVEQRLLSDPKFNNINLTLVLRNSKRLVHLSDQPRVNIIEGDLEDFDLVNQAMNGQDLVYVSNVDINPDNKITKNVIQAMNNNNVKRVISSNTIGIYDEVPGEFGRMNMNAIQSVLTAVVNSEKLLANSDLDYTVLRLPWLNDNEEINYKVTTKHQQYDGDYVSRQSVADLVLKIIDNPDYGSKDSLALANPNKQ
ncbi:NAD(P)H-binding protein, partial [Bacillus sp. S20C3]|uniref:NAD(P)H-binding protein n=1 Tax=Bacillus sp. S20C3 TaxID=2918910 RepID=UPI00227E1207|nr:NAD(P)H-binding protein [Bacillus sp. S20C3]